MDHDIERFISINEWGGRAPLRSAGPTTFLSVSGEIRRFGIRSEHLWGGFLAIVPD